MSALRNPADDNAEYYGPYHNGFAVRKALVFAANFSILRKDAKGW